MSITKSIGKNTLGGGKKMNVNLRTYNRSTHNLSYAWRSSMGVGTLTPFMKILALPGDTFDISLDTLVFTHPTIGPLFGSYKLQLDVFTAPIRLYNAMLHNNALNVGMNMAQVKLPKFRSVAIPSTETGTALGRNPQRQINPSCVLSYLGMKGFTYVTNQQKTINGVPLLAYLDIFKNYYANKQEEQFYAIQSTEVPISGAENKLTHTGVVFTGGTIEMPTTSVEDTMTLIVNYSTAHLRYSLTDGKYFSVSTSGTTTIYTLVQNIIGDTYNSVVGGSQTALKPYDLTEIDDLREYILSQGSNEVILDATSSKLVSKYIKDLGSVNAETKRMNSATPMSGLIIKTYQSDIFNNWIQTDWIDGENGISSITAIDTSSGEFTIDTLNLAKKVYDMLNRIAISGGTYHDWIETVFTAGSVPHAETPIYEGGLSTEIEFEQVVSNSATETEPLGTLAGRGRDNNARKKGGRLHIKITEPSYIMGIVSITPRVDYCQGEDWDLSLQTLDDLHKPALDGIGFQDLMARQMAWWVNPDVAVGKQPAWINYMTNFNKVYGNFAIKNNEMFMTLVKYFEPTLQSTGNIEGTKLDISTYIEPDLYNYIFADTSQEAQNFWVQIGCGIERRWVGSAKQIPNL